MEITDVNPMNQEDPTEKIDITELMLLTKRGKRSNRYRRKNFATWIPLQEHLNSKTVLRTCQNDQVVGSKMEYPHGGTRSWLVYKKRTAKGKKNIGGEGDANNHPITAILVDTKGSGADENAAENVNVPESDRSSVVLKDNNRASADAVEQIDVLMADNSSEFKERSGGADAFKQIGVPTSYTSAEIKQSSGANAVSIVKTGVLMTNTFIDLKENNGAVANALMQITDAISLHQAKENNAKIDPAVFSGLDPDTGAKKLDVSSAESALASLYGDSVADSCIEFAVKILMDETPLPVQAPNDEVFFGQKMNCKKSTIAGPCQTPRRWKN